MHPLLADEWIRAQVDAAVKPFIGALPADRIAWMREQLAETLATNPDAALLLRRAHPHPVEKSGEVAASPDLDLDSNAAEEDAKPGRSA